MFSEEIKKIGERISELKAKDELSIGDVIEVNKMERKLIGFKEIIETAEKLTRARCGSHFPPGGYINGNTGSG